MLSLPDFKEKKILYIVPKEGIEKNLKLENSNICLVQDGKIVSKLSIYMVHAIMIIGDSTITTKLIDKLVDSGVSIYFLGYNLKNKFHISAIADGNYLLRQKQYGISERKSLQIAKNIVINKIIIQRNILIKARKEDLSKVADDLILKINDLNKSDELLAREGYFSSKYFPLMFGDIGWVRRAPQTKEDEINVLLDIGYTILFNYIDSLLSLFGFDNYKGVYHREFYKRKSLVCDLMEPGRPLVDYTILKAINLKQINLLKDLYFDKGQFKLNDYDTSRKLIDLITNVLMDHKEVFYNYILSYYRFTSNPTKYNYQLLQI